MEQILGNLSLLFEFPVVNVKIIVDGVIREARELDVKAFYAEVDPAP